MRQRLQLLSLALLLGATSALSAQRDKEPRRPKLPAGADTNNAHVYYQFALQNLKHDAEIAADALYWSTRLEPSWADAFYARRIALLLTDKNRLQRYWSGERRTMQSDEIRRIDSLYYQALTLNPFVSQALDREIFETIADDIAQRYERDGAGTSGQVRYLIDREMMSAPPATKAWLAYGDGRYGEALELYARAIKDDKRNGPLHIDRARVFYQMGTIDSTIAELTLAIDDLRKRDKKDLVFVYQSKALTEQSIGVAHQRLGHDALAKEAFGRALQEDLAYAPAHMQLAYMAIEAKDTATALAEMDLAVQVRADDPVNHYIYGYTLANIGKIAEAEPQLRKAVELDRWYALPHYVLGFLCERKEKADEAAKEYAAFLALAPATDPRRAQAKERLEMLNLLMKP